MPTPTTDLICMSTEGSTLSSACIGSIIEFGYFWYPTGSSETISYLGRTWEMFFYWDGTGGSAERVLRETIHNNVLHFEIAYQDTGHASGSSIWTITSKTIFQPHVFVFQEPLIPHEWYRIVLRTLVGSGDTLIAPDFTSANNRMLIQIGRMGVTANGGASAGADTFPYGLSANGGFGQAFGLPSFLPYVLAIRCFGADQGNRPVRISWGGRMFNDQGTETDVNPVFSDIWQGGYCEERLWSGVLSDTEVLAGSTFVNPSSTLTNLRLNDVIGDIPSYVSTGTSLIAGQIGFSFGGSINTAGNGDVAFINHVDPGINVASENPTGYPAHPFKTVSIKPIVVSNSGYDVLYEATPIEEVGAYKVVKVVPIEPPGIYKVNVPGEITPNPVGAYKVLEEATPIEEVGSYMVLDDATPIENDGAYNILLEAGVITPAPQGEYDVVVNADEELREGVYRVISPATPVEEDGDYKVLIENEIEDVGAYRVIYSGTTLTSGTSEYFVIQSTATIPNVGAYEIAAEIFQINRQGAYAIDGVESPKIEKSGRYAVQVDAAGLADKALKTLGWERMNRLSGRP